MKRISIETRKNVDYSMNKVLTEMIENSFKNLEFDKNNFGTNEWNPLGDIIEEGNTVLIKPNLVMEKNKANLGEECLYTNSGVVAAILPYVCKALKGTGKIVIADAPMQSCNFQKLIKDSGYEALVDSYKKKKINIELVDLRGLISKEKNGILVQEKNDKSKDAVLVNLGKQSAHAKLNENEMKKLRITNYNPDELLKHHNNETHEYLIAKEVLEADVIINMPKPKSHRIAGVTIGMKNFVGTNVRKEYLPHHRIGDKSHGGDEYNKSSVLLRESSKLLDRSNKLASYNKYTSAKILRVFSGVFSRIDRILFSKEKNRAGSWYGNDTIWRTIVDINRIVKYADKNRSYAK